MLLIYNSHHDIVNFALPSVPEGQCWELLIDTNAPDARAARHDFGVAYAMTARSMVALELIARRADHEMPVT